MAYGLAASGIVHSVRRGTSPPERRRVVVVIRARKRNPCTTTPDAMRCSPRLSDVCATSADPTVRQVLAWGSSVVNVGRRAVYLVCARRHTSIWCSFPYIPTLFERLDSRERQCKHILLWALISLVSVIRAFASAFRDGIKLAIQLITFFQMTLAQR
jgi:hypothetical protein